jgi:hypothetical protein
MNCVYISNLETVKLKLATSILEFGTAKPSSVVPMGRTVKVCKHPAGGDWASEISRL